MLGNLSKILIRVPDFFNNSSPNATKQLDKLNNSENLNIFFSNNRIENRKYRLNKIYFREKDFWLNNFGSEMNFNNNKRSPITLKKYSLKSLSNKNIYLKNIETQNNSNIIKHESSKYLLTDHERLNNDKTKLRTINNIYKIKGFTEENNDFRNELRLKSESNQITKRNSLNINTNFKVESKNNNKIINNDKINNYKKSKNYKIKSEFPSIYKALKSQENLFQDKLDRRFNSLKLLRPEIKEQLREKNRNMVGKNEFLRYLNQSRAMFQNPFYESIKLKEETNNKK